MRPGLAALRLSTGFLIALAGAELIVRLVGPQMPEPSLWPTVETDIKSRQLVEMETEPALVLLGSSVTEAAVDPVMLEALTGLSSPYNSAMPFSSPMAYEIWFERVLLPAVNPELVLIGLPTRALDQGSSEVMVKGIDNATSSTVLEGVLGWSALVERSGVLAHWDRLLRRQKLKNSGFLTSLGHQIGFYGRHGGPLTPLVEPGETGMSPDQTAALKLLIMSNRDAGRDVILFIEPRRFHGYTGETEMGTYVRWLKSRANEWGVELWDANLLEWDDSYFADDLHFNKSGTKVFTAYLAELINDHLAGSE